MKSCIAFLTVLVLVTPLHAEDVLWKCLEPGTPLRYATTEEARDEQTPPCKDWVEIRGESLAKILARLSGEEFKNANEFLAKAGEELRIDYPESEHGYPVTTQDLYDRPEEFGFSVASLNDAPTGSLIVYNGLGGVLVETRESSDAPWKKQVLYPSAAHGFALSLANPEIPGKLAPKVLLRKAKDVK